MKFYIFFQQTSLFKYETRSWRKMCQKPISNIKLFVIQNVSAQIYAVLVIFKHKVL